MNRPDDNFANQRIAELEAENARLRQTLESVRADLGKLRERVYGPFPDEAARAKEEQELTEFMKNRVPGEGMKFFAELGLLPAKKP